MLLCNFCKNSILESGIQWQYHQKSYRNLEEAAAKLCVFCTSLREDVDTFCNKASIGSGVELKWPLYRWSIRKLGHIRGRREAVVVTFRSLPQIREESQGTVGREEKVGRGVLPDRTFYLFSENGNLLYDYASSLRSNVSLTNEMRARSWTHTHGT